MKKYLVVITLLVLILLSGCTFPDFWQTEDKEVSPMSVTIRSDLPTVKSGDKTWVYITLDNLDRHETYNVEARIMNAGIFDIPTGIQRTEVRELQRKDLEFELTAPEIYTNTPSTVFIETAISKSSEFYLPIYFADPEYLKKKIMGGEIVEEYPKVIYINDNLVSVMTELNKNPPIDEGVVYANIKLSPLGPGVLRFQSISIDSGSCSEINRLSNTVSCTLQGSSNAITEKKFRMTITYEYAQVDSWTFTVLSAIS